jgi:hypothetical protein
MKKKKLESAAHFDEGKVELDLIPYSALEECAKAFMYGQRKYSRWNYKKGMKYSKLINSALRHILKFKEGADFDEESITVMHIGHAMANLSMLIDVYKRMPEIYDDRYCEPRKAKKRKGKFSAKK